MSKPTLQFAAFPLKTELGRPQVLLVTSRETRRWILPKGRPEKKLRPYDVASKEAYEEAGVVGKITAKSMGSFPSFKRLENGDEIQTLVRVYRLDVTAQYDDWPERSQRQRQWVDVDQAASLVGEVGLTAFLLQVARHMSMNGTVP